MNEKSYNAMKKACENFVNKVETGRARSKESYKEMKEALYLDKEISPCEHENTRPGHRADQPHYCLDCGKDL